MKNTEKFHTPIVDMKKTGENICRLCEERGISVAEICDTLHLSNQAVYNWRNGKSLPSTDNIVALIQLFGVLFEEIVVLK